MAKVAKSFSLSPRDSPLFPDEFMYKLFRRFLFHRVPWWIPLPSLSLTLRTQITRSNKDCQGAAELSVSHGPFAQTAFREAVRNSFRPRHSTRIGYAIGNTVGMDLKRRGELYRRFPSLQLFWEVQTKPIGTISFRNLSRTPIKNQARRTK